MSFSLKSLLGLATALAVAAALIRAAGGVGVASLVLLAYLFAPLLLRSGAAFFRRVEIQRYSTLCLLVLLMIECCVVVSVCVLTGLFGGMLVASATGMVWVPQLALFADALHPAVSRRAPPHPVH